jgi:hypothetical protein
MYKRNQGVMLSYFVTCGEIPKDKLSEADNFIAGVNTEATQLILETDTFLVVQGCKNNSALNYVFYVAMC